MGRRVSLSDLIPQDRSWLPCACLLGCSFCLVMWSWASLAAFGFAASDAVFLVGGSVAGCFGILHVQKSDVVFADRVLSLAVIVYGVLLGMGLAAEQGLLFQACLLAACVALGVALSAFPSGGEEGREAPSDGLEASLLKKPLRYLVAYVACCGFSKGLLLLPFASALVPPDGTFGFSLGLLISGILMWAFMLCSMPDRGLDMMTRSALLLVVVGAFAFSSPLASVASDGIVENAALLLFAMGSGLLLFLALRMALDLTSAFRVPKGLPCGIALLHVAMMCLGGATGRLATDGLGASLRPAFALAAILIMVTVIVYGLSSERVWTARDLRKESEGVTVEMRPRWRAACEKVADECGLTPREREVFELLAKGRNSVAIEKRLVISNHTVKTHILSIYRKLGVHSAQELIDKVESEKR